MSQHSKVQGSLECRTFVYALTHTQTMLQIIYSIVCESFMYIYLADMGVDSEEDREMIFAKVYELFSQETEAYDDYDDIEGAARLQLHNLYISNLVIMTRSVSIDYVCTNYA